MDLGVINGRYRVSMGIIEGYTGLCRGGIL